MSTIRVNAIQNTSGVEVYTCKAWVSSITDNGTGDYTVNFTSAMPDANYSVVGSVLGSNANFANTVMTGTTTSIAAGSVRFRTGYSNAEVYVDMPFVHTAVFR
jgi:hypothetical protein